MSAAVIVCGLIPSLSHAQSEPPIDWLYGPDGHVLSMAYSPDGKLIAAGGSSQADWGTLQILRADTGALVTCLPTSVGAVTYGVAFSPDGKTLAVAGQTYTNHETFQGVTELWDVASGKLISVLQTGMFWCRSVSFSPDGRSLAIGGGLSTRQGDIQIWDIQSVEQTASFATKINWVTSVKFSPVGSSLAAGGPGDGGGTVELWNVPTQTLDYRETDTNAGFIYSLAYSPNGATIAAGYLGKGGSGYARVFDAATGFTNRILILASSPAVLSVAYSPDSSTLVVGGGSYQSVSPSLTTWSVSSGTLIATLPTTESNVTAVVFSPDGATIADGGNVTGTDVSRGVAEIERWDASTDTMNGASVLSAMFSTASTVCSPNSSLVAVGGAAYNGEGILGIGGVLELKQVSDGKTLSALPTAAVIVTSIAFSPDGKLLADCGDLANGTVSNSMLEVWNVSTGQLVFRQTNATDSRAVALAFSPDGKTLAIAGQGLGDDGFLQLWGVQDRQLIATFKSGLNLVPTAIAFSKDGKSIAVAGSDESADTYVGELELWSAPRGQLIRSFRTAGNPYAVAFSPDGGTLADGGDSYSGDGEDGFYGYTGMVELWDPATGREKASRELLPRQTYVSTLIYSPDGRALVAGTYNDIQVLAPNNLELLDAYIEQVGGGVTSLSLTPDGKHMVYGNACGGVIFAANPLYRR